MLGNSKFPDTSEISSTKSSLEKFFSKELCQRKEHQHPKFQLHHENGKQYCWGCLSMDIYQKRKANSFCDICYGFLKDWFELPLTQGDIFYKLQSKLSFRRIIPDMTRGLLQWLDRLGDLDNEILQVNVKEVFDYLQKNPEYFGIDEELFWATAMLRGCLESPFREDINYWIDMATDAGVVYDAEDTSLWTALWFWRVWKTIPTIHAEHMGWKPVSYAGPAMGMKQVNIPNGTNTSHQLDQNSSSFLPSVKEEPLLLLPLPFEGELESLLLQEETLASENTV